MKKIDLPLLITFQTRLGLGKCKHMQTQFANRLQAEL